MEQTTSRNSIAAIKAMIEHGLRPDADVNEQCLAENARALIEENKCLFGNLKASAEAHAADFAALGEAKKRIAQLERTNEQLDRSDKASAENGLTLAFELDQAKNERDALAAAVERANETLKAVGCHYAIDPATPASLLAARDAAQQRAGAVAALRMLADEYVEVMPLEPEWLLMRAAQIERGEVQL